MSVDGLGIETLRRNLREFADAARHLNLVSARVELKAGDKASLEAGIRKIGHAVEAQAARFTRNAEMRLILKELRETRVAELRKRFKKLAEAERARRLGARGVAGLELTEIPNGFGD